AAVQQTLSELVESLPARVGAEGPGATHFSLAGRGLSDLATGPEFAEFLTTVAYEYLDWRRARLNTDRTAMDKQEFTSALERAWKTDSRWDGVTRPYTAADVHRLRGSIDIEYSLARYGAARLWRLLQEEDYVAVLSAITGNQAIQEVQAGLQAIYVSGWQVAADANNANEMYPDQSLYPSDSVPTLLRRINNALKRADEIAHMKGDDSLYWFAPLVADAEAG